MVFLKLITILCLAKLIVYGNWVVFEYHIQNQTTLKDPEKYRIENTGDYPPILFPMQCTTSQKGIKPVNQVIFDILEKTHREVINCVGECNLKHECSAAVIKK